MMITLSGNNFGELIEAPDSVETFRKLVTDYLTFIGVPDATVNADVTYNSSIPNRGHRGFTLDVFVIPALTFYVRVESLEFWRPRSGDFRLALRTQGANRNKVSVWTRDTPVIAVIADMLAKMTGVDWLRKLTTKNSLTATWTVNADKMQSLIEAGLLPQDLPDRLFAHL